MTSSGACLKYCAGLLVIKVMAILLLSSGVHVMLVTYMQSFCHPQMQQTEMEIVGTDKFK